MVRGVRFHSAKAGGAMLRINYVQTETERRWTLCGQLRGPWVEELAGCWRQLRGNNGGARSVVDLTDVTFIDESGERLLSEMRGNGVEFVAAGVDTKHLLEDLKGEGDRPLRRFIAPNGCDKRKLQEKKDEKSA
jgi:hypothetical protein